GQIPVIMLRPDVAASRDVIELRGDAYPAALLAHAALDHIAHAEFLGDLTDVHGSALVDEGRIARDHEEPAYPGQCRDDVLADPVGEIFLLAVAAHVVESEHGDRRPVRYRQCPRRRIGRDRLNAVRHLADIADETNALAWNGPDQSLLLAAVADRRSGGIDAARQGRIRNDPATPDHRDQVILAEDAGAILHQMDQQIEHLRLQGDRLAAAKQFAPFGVKRMVVEAKLH